MHNSAEICAGLRSLQKLVLHISQNQASGNWCPTTHATTHATEDYCAFQQYYCPTVQSFILACYLSDPSLITYV